MSDLSFESIVKTNTSESSISYILEDEKIFYEVGYKVLQNQEKYGLLKCGKLYQNGKIKLVYGISKYKPLGTLLSQISQQNFLFVVSRIYDIARHVEENGFLRCENIETTIDRIFVDTEDLSVYLVCLPISTVSIHQNTQLFYENLKQVVLMAAKSFPGLKTSEVLKIIDSPKGEECSLNKEIKPKGSDETDTDGEPPVTPPQPLKGDYPDKTFGQKKKGILSNLFSRKKSGENTGASGSKSIELVSTNTKDEIRFVINKPEFLIGKYAGKVDGVIPNEKTISRIH
ncbi:MAG TPA: hypothetical protein GXX14_13175, partial [Clostridiaceae bacterium]|nr:hypothetical protein [Clostridiaceae bacterium]